MGINAVAFDFGNVISVPQDPATMERLAAIAGVSEDQARDIAFTGRGDWDGGALSGPDHYRRGFLRHGKEADDGLLAAFMRADLDSWATLNGETVALMEELIGAGVRTAILSNMPWEFIGTVRERFPIVGKVEVGVFSCEQSMVKPSPGIYRALLEKLALPPEDVLFFDDMEQNIEAARALGIEAHLWTGPAEARAVLASCGVLGR